VFARSALAGHRGMGIQNNWLPVGGGWHAERGRRGVASKPIPMPLSQEDLRRVGLWAAACAQRALPVFESHVPEDFRPRAAVAGIKEFARGGKRTAHLRSLAWAAHAAAREVRDPAAAAAARAACLAAAVAYTHPVATPHQTRHALGPAAYAALARERAQQGDPRVGDREVRWAIERASRGVRAVIRRMSAVYAGRSRLGALLHRLDVGLRGGYRSKTPDKALPQASVRRRRRGSGRRPLRRMR
jgi:hypothetical protein